MSVEFIRLTSDLRTLTSRLMQRCAEAEHRVKELEQQNTQQQATISELRKQVAETDAKYRNLKVGMVAAGDSNPEQRAQLREQFLAMVSEIDACIAQLQHG